MTAKAYYYYNVVLIGSFGSSKAAAVFWERRVFTDLSSCPKHRPFHRSVAWKESANCGETSVFGAADVVAEADQAAISPGCGRAWTDRGGVEGCDEGEKIGSESRNGLSLVDAGVRSADERGLF